MNNFFNKTTSMTLFLITPITFFFTPIRFLLRHLFIPIFAILISPYLSIVYSIINFIFSILRFIIFLTNIILLHDIYVNKDRLYSLLWLFFYGFSFFIVKKIGVMTSYSPSSCIPFI